MKEREPDFEDDKVRASQARSKEPHWEDMDKDPTVIAIDEETEEVFESRVYRIRTHPETFGAVLRMLWQRLRSLGADLRLDEAVDQAANVVDEPSVKFLAKRRKEDGRITYLLVGISPESRRIMDRRELVEETDYRKAVEAFEELPLFRTILAEPVVLTYDECCRYADESVIPTEHPQQDQRPPSSDHVTRTHHPPGR